MPDFVLGRDEVDQIDRTLAALEEHGGEVTLRFGNHWADGENPAVLAAALMGPLRTIRVRVDAEDDEAVDGLLKYGVATALSRRGRDVTSFIGSASRLDLESLRLLWTPGSRAATEALFGAVDTPGGAYGPQHATFVNPHLSTASDGNPDVVFLVRRWLTRRASESGLFSSPAQEIVAAVGLAVDELVSNVQEHARSDDYPSPDCLLRVSLSGEAVRISVLDTGTGLYRSLSQKLATDPDLSAREPAEIIEKLLDGSLPGWENGRGLGLARVARCVAAMSGRLSVATCSSRVARVGTETTTRDNGFLLEGTVIDCAIPIAQSS